MKFVESIFQSNVSQHKIISLKYSLNHILLIRKLTLLCMVKYTLVQALRLCTGRTAIGGVEV